MVESSSRDLDRLGFIELEDPLNASTNCIISFACILTRIHLMCQSPETSWLLHRVKWLMKTTKNKTAKSFQMLFCDIRKKYLKTSNIIFQIIFNTCVKYLRNPNRSFRPFNDVTQETYQKFTTGITPAPLGTTMVAKMGFPKAFQ